MICSVQNCGKAKKRTGKYCSMHSERLRRHGDLNHTDWRRPPGTGSERGYIGRSVNGKIRPDHALVVERILGRRLPKGAVIHHVDENKANNAPTNLVVCPSRAYHNLIHKRMRALAACGNADWLKCDVCGQYDDPARLSGAVKHYHKACAALYQRNRRR